MTCSMPGLASSSSRTASTVICAASSSGKPPTPVPSAGKAMLVAPISRARAIALRTAASITAALVRRSRSSETAWMTTLAASDPAGVTMAPPSGTGAWRTASNSMASPPARLSAPPTPVDIHSDRLAAFTIASTSRSQMSPFQSSIRAKRLPLPLGESPQADRSRGGMVHPGQSAGHVSHHLPRVRVAQPRQLLDGDRGVARSPDEDELVAEVDGRSGDVGDVGHDGIHGHVPDERHATAADERLGTVRQRARPAVAIAQRQGRDAAGACRPQRGTVADAGARRELRDPDRACDEGHDGPEPRPGPGDTRVAVELIGEEAVDGEAGPDAVVRDGIGRHQPGARGDVPTRQPDPGGGDLFRSRIEPDDLLPGAG